MNLLSRIKTGFRAYTREFRDPKRCYVFWHNRLWVWLPAVALVLFLAGYLQRFFGEGVSLGSAMVMGAIEAASGAFCYAIGIWGSTAPTEEQEEASGHNWIGYLIFGGLLLLAFSMICVSEIIDLWAGEGSVGRNLGAIFVKLVCLTAVVAPIWLTSKR